MLKPYQSKALFLDFDGVLHPPDAIEGARPPLTSDQIRRSFPGTFQHLPILRDLLHKHDEIAVIVSSSWRLFLSDAELIDLLAPISTWFAGSLSRYKGKDEAIRDWLAHHQVNDFAVLDDVAQFFPEGSKSLILCDPRRGLSDPVVQERVKRWLQFAGH
ncbi:HAD domain-containing protein [Comamonas testosteroni]|uniref:HAD domain-containing protein n=1 Tax=Comamonas testosteroni TaxID=285 RepID=UPI003AF0D2D3